MPIEARLAYSDNGEEKWLGKAPATGRPAFVARNLAMDGLKDIIMICAQGDIGGEIYEIDATLHKPDVLPDSLWRYRPTAYIWTWGHWEKKIITEDHREAELRLTHDTDLYPKNEL